MRKPLGSMLIALALLIAATTASPASAATPRKVTRIDINGGNCGPEQAIVGYTQNAGNAEPQVGDIFYVTVRFDMLVSFDCAAEFANAVVTLPANVTPTASATPVCERWSAPDTNFDAVVAVDPRMQSACPTSIAFNDPGTRQFRIGPKAGTPLPDSVGAGGAFFFAGQYRSESYEFEHWEMAVPVKATSTMTNQNIGFSVCAIGSACPATGSVPLTVGAAPPAPTITLGDAATSSTGARVPYSVNAQAGQQWALKIDTSESANFTGPRPCGAVGPNVFPDPGMAYVGPTNDQLLSGEFNPNPNPCFLTPNTTYYVKVCTVNASDRTTELDCDVTSLTTPPVSTSFEPPDETTTGHPDSTQALFSNIQVLAGHPAGTLNVQRRLLGTTTYANAYSQSASQATTSTTPVTTSITGFATWRHYQVRSCFSVTSGPNFCGDPRTILTGVTYADTDASVNSPTSATASGRPSAPYQSGSFSIRYDTANPGDASPATALSQVSAVTLAARSSTTLGSVTSRTLTDLAPGTRYFWAACFDVPEELGVEDCSAVRTFITSLPSSHAVSSGGVTNVTTSGMTLNATVVGAHAPGGLRFRTGPVGGALNDVTQAVLPGSASSVAAAFDVSGLQPDSAFDWQACYVSSGVPTVCTPVATARTAALPVTPPVDPTPPVSNPPASNPPASNPPATNPPGTTPGTTTRKDTTPPTVEIRISGKLKRGRKITVTVVGKDASGIKTSTLKIGSAKAKTVTRAVSITLPRKSSSLKLVATVTDKAGNVRIATKTLKLKR